MNVDVLFIMTLGSPPLTWGTLNGNVIIAHK